MSTFIKHYLLAGLLILLLAACSPVAAAGPAAVIDNPNAPQPGDSSLVRNDVQLVSTQVAAFQGSAYQESVTISFFKPTPCHEFRVEVSQPDAKGQISIQVYSLRKGDQVCALMATTNPTQAVINLGGLASGHYTLVVNGSSAAEFDV